MNEENTQATNTEAETTKEIPSSVFPKGDVEAVNKKQLMMNTWVLLGGLMVLFFLLKTFIYIKDDKRHGK
ncbi:MAG: hypothetical protein JNM93_10785 [Bacteriovoracaceae bacterium]|nr:hypothetical protein [Bacteriovoracaceae bacterium]